MTAAAVAGSLLVAVGCGGANDSDEFELRIYDAAGKVRTEITSADIVRRSARAMPVGGEGYGSVSVALTPAGTWKFCRLTRAVARRGTAVGKRQRLVIEINDRVETRPFIDHEATPDGICGAPAIQMEGVSLVRAQALAAEIRGDNGAD